MLLVRDLQIQASAVYNVAKLAALYDVPILADGLLASRCARLTGQTGLLQEFQGFRKRDPPDFGRSKFPWWLQGLRTLGITRGIWIRRNF